MQRHTSSEGYKTGATAYASGRPGYPPEALDCLRDVVRVGPGRNVLELGAGTGKFMPLLRQCGGTRKAVEPIDAVRAQLTADFPEVEALAGSAEAILLPDASVGRRLRAGLFHWFANVAALQEIRRVLVPGGVLGLIWNGRDETVTWAAELSTITDIWEGNTPRYVTGEWRHVFPAPGFEAIDERHARNAHVGTAEQVIVKRTLSVSFIAVLPREQQADVEEQVKALIARTADLAKGGAISFPYETSMFAYRKL